MDPVMASSMKLEYPLNDALPNIEHTRDRLLAKIFDFRKNAPDQDVATEEDYELLYAFGTCDVLCSWCAELTPHSARHRADCAGHFCGWSTD